MPSELAPLAAVAGLILVKEAGLPVPVPGDLIVIGAGVAAGRGELDPLTALLAIVIASIAGGLVQYGLLRSVARPAILRLLGRLGSAERIDRQVDRLGRGGARSVAIARSTPGVRIVAIAASALAGIPATAFVTGLSIGNAVFIAAHFGLGYLVGEPIVAAAGGLLGHPDDRRGRTRDRRWGRLVPHPPSAGPWWGRSICDGGGLDRRLLPGLPDACRRGSELTSSRR